MVALIGVPDAFLIHFALSSLKIEKLVYYTECHCPTTQNFHPFNNVMREMAIHYYCEVARGYDSRF